ncbi:hypothetical protein HZA87_01680 [Candidatus Uhrbacteria bacterium]|nr:hypothetical protein [Candidatus Uhrbacteria bacterium]
MKITFVGKTGWVWVQQGLTQDITEHLLPVVGKAVVVHFPEYETEPDIVEPMDFALEEPRAFHVFLFGRFYPTSDTGCASLSSFRVVLREPAIGSPICNRGYQTPMGEQIGNVACLRVRMRYGDEAPRDLWKDFVHCLAQHLKEVEGKRSMSCAHVARQNAEALLPCSWAEKWETAKSRLRDLERQKGEAQASFLDATKEAESFALRVQEQMDRVLDVGEFQAELDRMFMHPLLEDAFCVQNGNPDDYEQVSPALVVRTKEIIVSVARKEGEGMERRRIGRFEIRVPLNPNHTWGDNVHFTNLDRVIANLQGPHIDADGWPCFGTGEDSVEELFKEGRVAELIEFCLHYLQRVNMGDDWGRNIHEWPLVEEATSPTS